jgi:tetratricopeptide (TPR) repeat protein
MISFGISRCAVITRLVLTVAAVAAPAWEIVAAGEDRPAAAGATTAATPPPPKAAEKTKSPVDEATALRAAGRLDNAIQILRNANRDIKQADGEESPRLLPVNNLAAEILIDQGQLEAAKALVEKTMTLHESLIKADKASKESLGKTLLVLARVHATAQRFLPAIEKAAQALPLLDKLEGPRSADVARGSEILETSVEKLEGLLGPHDTMTTDARAKAGDVFESLGRFDQAIAQRKGYFASISSRGDRATIDAAAERLGRLMGLAGRAHEAIAILSSDANSSSSRMRLLGDLQLAANHLLAADVSFESAMNADAALPKPPTTQLTGDRLRRLLVAARRGRVNALPDWFEPTLASLAKAAPADSAAGGLVAGSEVLMSLGKPASAAVPLNDAVMILKKQQAQVKGQTEALLTQAAASIAEMSGRLAGALLASGDAAATLKLAEPAMTAAADVMGPGDGRVTLLRAMAAGAASGQGDGKISASLASDALAYGLPRPDDAWEEVLVSTYDRLATGDDQKKWREDFIAARVRQFGERHPHVATAWELFGVARLAAGDWPSAIECISKALDLQRASLGEKHPETAASLSLLAHAQRAGGDPAQAERTAAEAVGILEQIVGRNHPATLEAVDVLVAARLQAGMKDGVNTLLERLCTADTMTMSDPVRRAYHLVRLAEVTATTNKVSARMYVQDAMKLPCWNSDQPLTQSQRRRMAETAAYAVRAYRMMDDEAAGQATLLKARSIALRLDQSGALLDRIERLATPER